MINAQNLIKTYKVGGVVINAVSDVSLKVLKGETVSILGHSGSGKTTLLSILGGLTRPDSGSVAIDSIDILRIPDDELSRLRNRKINFIFQFSSLIPTLTVLENVLLPTVFGEIFKDADRYALELLKMTGIDDKADMYPSQLSGGQQRRVAIARAFVNNPEIILADEPTGDLDEETESEMMALFKKMNEEKNITFVIVTHSTDIAARCKTHYTMTRGVLSRRAQ
jgi:putative ABC transport system ATP-binding protein/lipoprotein-releasing system ATP-binding protein